MTTDDDTTARLTRIEGMLTMLLNHAELEEAERSLKGEIRLAYRRGYFAGRDSVKRGSLPRPDLAFERGLVKRATRDAA